GSLVPEAPCRSRRRVQRLPVAPDNHILHSREDRIAGLRRFWNLAFRSTYDPLPHALGRIPQNSTPLKNRFRILKSRAISDRRTRADYIEIVADHVRKNQSQHARRSREPRELSAFQPRDVLPYAIHLMDIRARAQQQLRDFPRIAERDGRRGSGHQGGGAAGNQADYQIAFAGRSGDRLDALRSPHAVFVRDGMAAFAKLDPARCWAGPDVAVFHVHPPGFDTPPEFALRRVSHHCAGLTSPDDEHLPNICSNP